MSTKIINIGLLGLGRIAGHHCKAIKKIKNFKIVAACDLFKKKRENYLRRKGIKIYDHYDKMLTNEKNIDIVVIMSPSGMHFEHAYKILSKYKKNVVIEKPTSLKISNLKKLYTLSKKVKKKIYPVYQNRNNKCVIKLKDLVKSGKLGKINLVNLILRWSRPQRYYDLSVWRGTYSHDGGALTNQGIHYIDLLRYLVGDVKKVYCKMGTFGAKIEVEDSVVGNLEFNSGAIGSIEVTTAARPKDYEATISLIGTKGVAKIGGLAANIMEEYSPNPSLCKLYSENIPDAYGFGHNKFYNDVKNDFIKIKKFPIKPDDCIETVRLLNSFYVSDEQKKIVSVKKIKDSSRLGVKNEKISKIYR